METDRGLLFWKPGFVVRRQQELLNFLFTRTKTHVFTNVHENRKFSKAKIRVEKLEVGVKLKESQKGLV